MCDVFSCSSTKKRFPLSVHFVPRICLLVCDLAGFGFGDARERAAVGTGGGAAGCPQHGPNPLQVFVDVLAMRSRGLREAPPRAGAERECSERRQRLLLARQRHRPQPKGPQPRPVVCRGCIMPAVELGCVC
eukprot:1465197-Rhodomonas_salina.1